MSQVIPEKYRDLFQKRAFASLGTLMPDGRPQVTPVWVDFDGEHVIFNSAKGRQKDRNVRRDPRVSLAIIDPENPYRYLEIRGRVVEITEDGADDSINKLAKKYLGVDKYPYAQPGEVRVHLQNQTRAHHGDGLTDSCEADHTFVATAATAAVAAQRQDGRSEHVDDDACSAVEERRFSAASAS